MTIETAIHPLAIARNAEFQAGGERSSALFRALAAQFGSDRVGVAWIQACLATDQGAA